ncbi:glycosyl hydrolase family 28-related protein [Streptomyces sp. BH105]|uniref:right-handed parallel beta-helix repeat-containing protein n=1 Tax=Streptomyces sp. BH105 TaxID=3410408 RepID=UPI003CEF00FB
MAAYARADTYVEEHLTSYGGDEQVLAGPNALTVGQADGRYVRLGLPITLSIPLASAVAFSVRQDTDAAPRLSISPSGDIGLGPGTEGAPADVRLFRSGPGTLGLDAGFLLNGNAEVRGDLEVTGALSIATLNIGSGAVTALGWVNVSDYGAKGDDVTDDTAALNRAMAACKPGNIVYLPAGRYRVSATLVVPPGVTLLMPHANMMVVPQLTDPVCSIKPLPNFTGTAVIRLEDAVAGGYSTIPAEHRLINVMIDGSGFQDTPVDGIQAKGNIQNVVLRGVTIRYMSGNGIYTDVANGWYPYSWRLYSVMVDNCHGHGYAFTRMTDITMFDCQSIGNWANGFYLDNLANSHLIGCRAEWCGNHGYLFTGDWGTGMGSGAVVMSACSTDRNGWDGIHIDSAGTPPYIFSGLMLRRDGRNGGNGGNGYAGLATYGTTMPVILSGVTVFPGTDDGGAGVNSPQYGINIQNGTKAFVLNEAYVHGADGGVRDDGSNTQVLIGPDVLTATGTTAAPVIAPTAPWNWLGTATARHTAAASNILQAGVKGEAFLRMVMRADGLTVLGPGTAAPDTPLFYRGGPGNIQTDSYLVMSAGQSNGAFTSWSATAKALVAGAPGGGVAIAEGTNARMGLSTLAAGTVTVANTSVTANTRVATFRQTAGGTLGHLAVTKTAGTGFTITSSSNAETSTVAWVLFEPA